MTKFKHIALLLITSIMAMTGWAATYESITMVKTDGTRTSYSVQGLKITYDDYAHAVISNDETIETINLTDLDHMCFTNEAGSTYPTGDVNGDGEVSIADLNAMIDIILGSIADEATTSRADLNADGEVTVADVNVLIDIILTR